MCGIAGLLYADAGTPVEGALLAAMGDAISHRGPDAAGYYSRAGVGLVHRRLSIIDLAGGNQPMGNEDGSVQVVFNGEIYNYRELRRDLEAKGHRFATDSDTETLVHLYEEHGEGLVDRLRGMFAFALWDDRQKRLVLARNRVGIKPLYYLRDDERLIFGSELKAILAVGGVGREIDAESLEDYLAFGMVTGERTIFRGIRRLPAGHVLTIEAKAWNRAPRKYWQLNFRADEALTEQEWQESVRAKIDETVKAHLIADVPVGAFLSGGIDSSIVTALAAGSASGGLSTFSIGFAEDSHNELPLARLTAGRYGTRHVEEVVTADAASLLDTLCWHYDEPFADSSAIPTMLVSRLAARHVKVVLSGDGGDEAFGGYARYPHDLREAAVRQRLPKWLRRRLLAPLSGAWPKADRLPRWLRAKTTLTNLSLDEDAAYANTLSICRAPARRKLLARDIAVQLNGHRPERLYRDAYLAAEGDALSRMIATDVATLLPDDFLVKVDRASMAYGLEVRPPFLDHELLELAATIPSLYKIRDGQTKWFLKRACADLLPDELLHQSKRGFEIPVNAWLRGPLAGMFRELVLDNSGPVSSLIDQRHVAALFDAHGRGAGRHGPGLWSLLVLALGGSLFGRQRRRVHQKHHPCS